MPYFAARSSAKQAQLVTLPYNLLLQKDARNALGISLEGCIVLIDEAHNLIDTILSTHSVTIDSRQDRASVQADRYLPRPLCYASQRFERVNLRKVRKLLSSMSAFFSDHAAKGKQNSETVMTAADLVSRMTGSLDQINLVTLETWLKETQIARKISGYADKQIKKADYQIETKASSRSGLQNKGQSRHQSRGAPPNGNAEATPSASQSAYRVCTRSSPSYCRSQIARRMGVLC